MNESIRAWNARLAQYAAELPGRYPGAEVELYDTATWLDETLDRIEASGALITDSWCEAYQPVSWRLWPDVPEDYADPACPAPLKQYAWIDGSHPSWPLHRLLAFDVVRKLSTPAHGHTFRRRAGHLGPVLEGRSGARHGAARGWWARRGGVHGGRGRGRRGGGRKVPKGRLFG
ncbi:hypothetical protein DMC30DRAFT_262591 [Rhodotorula diobovata]|uniref:Uncharacterized protein n=1 Tax=Rhodotorula diobovata TaxID=5288 RepID=A0A5C5FX54_9BASI|nr:hypothetical protein DMC30DRAFT_262591 [Rhodotorula diobovata]